MRAFYWFLSLMFLAFIVACGPAAPVENERGEALEIEPDGPSVDGPSIAPTQAAEQNNLPENPTNTPPLLPEAYPDPSTPTSPPAPEGYPAASVIPPTPIPAYPVLDEFVWIVRPVSEQCAEPDQNNYADLQEAVAALTAAGITTGKAEMTNLIVCSACGCPTSAHFRIQIGPADLPAAESLEWAPE
ncbi:MAG: hypothetical protein GY803_08030 [Chloroflexi bacterium]|nr:hypothetical protein [Chloroflexota bacterium]